MDLQMDNSKNANSKGKKIFLTGIYLSLVFDKISSNILIEIVKEIIDEDELVMIKYQKNSPSEITYAYMILII